MSLQFERLLARAAEDGASCPVGMEDRISRTELEDLYRAWSLERKHRIEAELLLDRARRLILRLLGASRLATRWHQRGDRLCQAIRALRNADG